MKAQNLTISVPSDKCDKNCPYCISRITWQTEPNIHLMRRNLQQVKNLTSIAGVTNVLLTSKKEPFQNFDEVIFLAKEFIDSHWVEVQTNGIEFSKNPKDYSKELYLAKVNILAISIDKMKQLNRLQDAIKIATRFDLVIRICINISGFISDTFTFEEIMRNIISVGNVRQVLLRNINYPTSADPNSPEVLWIDQNVTKDGYKNLYDEMIKMKLDIIRTIPQTGVTTYDYDGISVCFSDYCIQESNEHENIRSLIFQDDGHVYTSWDKRSSILF